MYIVVVLQLRIQVYFVSERLVQGQLWVHRARGCRTRNYIPQLCLPLSVAKVVWGSEVCFRLPSTFAVSFLPILYISVLKDSFEFFQDTEHLPDQGLLHTFYFLSEIFFPLLPLILLTSIPPLNFNPDPFILSKRSPTLTPAPKNSGRSHS